MSEPLSLLKNPWRTIVKCVVTQQLHRNLSRLLFLYSRPDTQVYETPVQTRSSPSDPSAPRPPSRLDYSLLRYTPLQYSSMLSSITRDTATSPLENAAYSSPVQPHNEEPTSPTSSDSELSSSSSNQARSSPSRIYTPFMKLMEITANINVDWSEWFELESMNYLYFVLFIL